MGNARVEKFRALDYNLADNWEQLDCAIKQRELLPYLDDSDIAFLEYVKQSIINLKQPSNKS